MLLNILPVSLKKYFQMSKRQRKHEVQLTLWYMPALYILASLLFVALTIFLDMGIEISEYTYGFFQINGNITRILVSTLIGGILTLSAFTMNSLLVVLTTFSGQFSPRMLFNFISDKRTQHALGIFNGSFVYVLLVFLFIGNSSEGRETYVAVPLLTIFLALLTAITFIFFINHATTWMQVHNITYTMKKSSENIIHQSLSKELEQYRCEEPNDLMEEERKNETQIGADASGYIQLVNYKKMIEEARKDNIIVQFHSQVGDFTLKDNVLLSFWGPGSAQVDKEKYCRMIEIGHKETELQDIQMGMHKLAEIAIKSLSNDDPKSATNTIHQMAELMMTVEDYITFTPYLMDEDSQVRVILREESFEYYIYRGFGYIRHYARDNHLIITEMIYALGMIAESIDSSKHQMLWEFAYNTLDHIETKVIYRLDKTFLLEGIEKLAILTDNIYDYHSILQRFYPQENKR